MLLAMVMGSIVHLSMHAVLLQMEYKSHTFSGVTVIHWLLLSFDTGSVKAGEEGEEMVQATLDHETVYDPIDEYELELQN